MTVSERQIETGARAIDPAAFEQDEHGNWLQSADRQRALKASRAALTAALSDQADVPVEVRLQNDAIDEIVIKRADTVHIEQMSADGWFMGVSAADGSYWQFWFGAKNRKSHVEFRHTETTPPSSTAGEVG